VRPSRPVKAKIISALVLLVLAGTFLAAGCGGSERPKVPPTPLPSYLALYPREKPVAVYFLQWEQAGDSVDGTLTVAYPNTNSEVSTTTEPVTGEIDDEEVSLDVGTDPTQEWKGTRAGQTVMFEAELSGGATQTLTFVPAKLAAYKRAVAALR
jgi:hypothetical protein